MKSYEGVQNLLRSQPSSWLVTGAAGFIGSNLVEKLLLLNQRVIGADNFATGSRSNLEQVKELVGSDKWRNFVFVEGDILDLQYCAQLCDGVDHVLHQAALGSVPRSINDPIASNAANVGGFLNIITASKDSGVKSFTYAASSSIYGDHPALPKVEETIGKPLSPYAVTKYVNELYGTVFSSTYGFSSTGLRYFNVFGPRQSPNGAYAAVIPKWTESMINGETVTINGDGETSRDFCYVDNVVQANILAATTSDSRQARIYNVAVGQRNSLKDLFETIKASLAGEGIKYSKVPRFESFREGDVLHSLADISKAQIEMGYYPSHSLAEGIAAATPWYIENLVKK